jgi:hypothetical protein
MFLRMQGFGCVLVNTGLHRSDKGGKHMRICLFIFSALLVIPVCSSAANVPVSPNGIALYEGYRNWQMIAPSYREDKKHIRAILGNPVAMQAMRDKVRPMPDGAVLAKIAWTVKKHPKFPVATEPDAFVQVEFMVKDAIKYKETGGWGYARFVGNDYKPYGKDASFVKECVGCHTPVKDNDYLFTSFSVVP